jgi:hypothetical protein
MYQENTARLSVILGAVAKLRKAASSFVMSVNMKQLGTRWTDFHGI